jgi:hypothetical protein
MDTDEQGGKCLDNSKWTRQSYALLLSSTLSPRPHASVLISTAADEQTVGSTDNNATVRLSTPVNLRILDLEAKYRMEDIIQDQPERYDPNCGGLTYIRYEGLFANSLELL